MYYQIKATIITQPLLCSISAGQLSCLCYSGDRWSAKPRGNGISVDPCNQRSSEVCN